jgi:hypothetical protein
MFFPLIRWKNIAMTQTPMIQTMQPWLKWPQSFALATSKE